MPAESRSQQRFMGMVHAVQKGTLDSSKVSSGLAQTAKQMNPTDVMHFAKTKHKKLPEHVKKAFERGFLKAATEAGVGSIPPPEITPALLGGAIPLGALLGAGTGALIPSKDQKGETHRGRNALIGMGLGGGLAGVAAGGLGKSFDSIVNADWKLQQQEMNKPLLERLLGPR